MSKVKATRPAFDPNKNYKWEPTDIFELSLNGQQFASLYHLVNQEMSVVGGAPLNLKVEVYNLVMDVFKNLIAEGMVKEKVDEVTKVEEASVHQLFK